MIDQLPIWLGAASLGLNALFLRRLLLKLDLLFTWIVGTPDTPGMADRLRHVESMLDIEPVERRHPEPEKLVE